MGAAACGATPAGAATSVGEITDQTAGPFPGDGSNGPDVLAESGIVRGDIRSSFGTASGIAEGVPMTLELTLTDIAVGTPFAGVAVYVWHCTREGESTGDVRSGYTVTLPFAVDTTTAPSAGGGRPPSR